MANLTPWLDQKFYLADGVTPNAGGKVFAYYPGSSTKKSTFVSEGGAANTNPIILNSAGECNLWFADGGYKIINAPANDTDPPAAAIKTWDDINVSGTGGEGAGIAVSIAALKEMAEGAFESVQLLGYYAPDGSGAGLFYWDATNTAADNGGTVIAPTISDGTGRWILIQDTPIAVTQFGAKGDGVTDDYAPFAAAFTAAGDGGVVYAPRPSVGYLIGTTIAITGYSVTLKGEGSQTSIGSNEGTLLLKKAGMSTPVISVRGNKVFLQDFGIDDAAAYGGGATGSTGDGIQVIGSRSYGNRLSVFRMANDGIRFGETGTHHNMNAFAWDVLNTRSNGRDGLHLEPQDLTTTGDLNAGWISNVNSNSNGRYGVYVGNVIINTFLNFDLELNTGHGLHVADGSVNNTFMFGDFSEANGTYDIYEEDSGVGTIKGNRYFNMQCADSRFRRGTGKASIDMIDPTTSKSVYSRILDGQMTIRNSDNNLTLDTPGANQFAALYLNDNLVNKGAFFKRNTNHDIGIQDATAERITIQQGSALLLKAPGSSVTISSGTLVISDTTDATSTITGSSTSLGGLGIAKALWVGGLANIAGSMTGQSSIKSTSATAGLGYATGAGGTVTQATDKTTGVTLSKVSGQITMNGAALAAGTTVSFTLTNTAIAAGDILVMNHVSAGTAGAYTLNAQCGTGSASINVRNVTAGSLSEAIVIGFVLVKGVTA